MVNSITKGSIVKCVNAAAEMEKRIYVLNQVDRECREKINSMRGKLSITSQNLENKSQRLKAKLGNLEKKLKEERKGVFKFTFEDLITVAKKYLILLLILLIPMDLILSWFFEEVLNLSTTNGFNVFLAYAIYFIVAAMFLWYKMKFDQIKRIKKIQGQIKETQVLLKNAENDISSFKTEDEEGRFIIDRLVAQSETCRNSASEIQNILSNYYRTTNIIPPSYRTIDCLIIFQHVFKNDLADNMRQAIEYYETKVFRGEVIRGIKSLYLQLGQISSSLYGIQDELSGLNNQISEFSVNAYKIAGEIRESQNEMIKNQKTLINESQATRYAMESIRYSRTVIK